MGRAGPTILLIVIGRAGLGPMFDGLGWAKSWAGLSSKLQPAQTVDVLIYTVSLKEYAYNCK